MNRITEENQKRFEQFVRDVMTEYEAAGMAVCVFDKTGVSQYERYFGYRNEEEKTLIDKDTVFGLASVTKSFTCLAVMQLAEQGKLNLMDPVSRYIPEFTGSNQTDPVRIWHLMCHTGGYFPLPRILIEDVANEMGLDEERDGDFAYHEGLAIEGVKRVAQRLDAQTQLNGRPGENMSYCNDGFALLSDIIRTCGDKDSYAEYLLEHIIKPLGMTRSYCDFVRPKQDENSAALYIKRDGKRVVTHNYHDNAFVLNGGGAMKSTISDMKKYICMYLNEGRGLNGVRVASEYSIREMVKPRITYRPMGYYGYGLSSKFVDDLNVIEHGGSLTGVSSNMSWSYDGEVGIMVLCNTSAVPVAAVADAALRMYNGKDPIDKRDLYQETPWTQQTIDQACGVYESGEGALIELYKKEDGSIGMRNAGKETDIRPVHPYLAITKGKLTDGYLKLLHDEKRGVWAVFNGRIVPRKKAGDKDDAR